MALADRHTKPDNRTRFEVWLDSLTSANSKVVRGWLDDTSISARKLAPMIREDDADDDFVGYPATRDTIKAWRNKHHKATT